MPRPKHPNRPAPLHATLEGWRCLAAVVDHQGYAAAAEALDKSQSAVSHQISRLQEQLGVALLRLDGRRAVLTDTGRVLLLRARNLLDQAARLERAADAYASGAEPALALAVDALVPRAVLAGVLAQFAAAWPNTRCDLYETVLSGAAEALLQGTVQLAITGPVPAGFMPEPLLAVPFQAVAAPTHPLLQQAELVLADLRPHRQLVVRDSGLRQSVDAGWLGAESRWTVGSLGTSAALVRAGLGFAWLPEQLVADDLASGTLVPLPLGQHSRRSVTLMLVQADAAGPAQAALGQALRAGFSGR